MPLPDGRVDPNNPAEVQAWLKSTWSKLGQGGGFGLGDFTGLASGMATDGAHLAGTVASNPYTQAAAAAALAATGVGVPASAAIMAGMRGGGALLKDGGNIGDGIKGGIEGAAIGTAASKAGSALHTDGSLIDKAKAVGGALLPSTKNADGSSGGVDWQKLLGLAGTVAGGVGAYQGAKANGAGQDAALARNVGISDTLQAHGTDVLAGAAPIRHAAESALSTRLAAGAPAPVNLSRFSAGSTNPFKKRYGPAVPPPPGV